MSRKKLVWISVATWGLVAYSVTLMSFGHNTDAAAWNAARRLSVMLYGWVSPSLLESLFEFTCMISVVPGIVAIPVALAASAALLGACVTRYPGK